MLRISQRDASVGGPCVTDAGLRHHVLVFPGQGNQPKDCDVIKVGDAGAL